MSENIMRHIRYKMLGLLFVFVFFAACKKDKAVKTINVSGKVLNELTNQPIQGITVSLNETCGTSSLGSSGGWSTIMSTTTDNNGLHASNKEVSDCSRWIVDINASPNYNSKYS